jgi:hypothetical protein
VQYIALVCRFSPPPAVLTSTGASSPSKGVYVTSPRCHAHSPTQVTRPQPFHLSTGRVKTPRSRSATPKAERQWHTAPCLKDPFANTRDRAAAQRAASPGPLSSQQRPFHLHSVARHEQCVERAKAQQQVQLTAEAKCRHFRARPTSPAVCILHINYMT